MLNLKDSTIRSRIRGGWSIEKAKNTPLKKSRYIKDLCEQKGISYSTVLGRMINKGLTVEEALSKPNLKYKLNGQSLHKILPSCEYERIRKRMINGMTLEEAISVPVANTGLHNKINKRKK